MHNGKGAGVYGKHRWLARFLALGLMLALFLSYGALPVAAAPVIGLTPNSSNLFSDFGNLLPGESKTGTFVVKNLSNTTCDFTLRAESARQSDFATNAEMQDSIKLLNLLEMRVVLVRANNSRTLLYDGKANQSNPSAGSALVGRTVNLGRLGASASVKIEATVRVPHWLDNSFETMKGKFRWNFGCNEYVPPTPPSSSSTPTSSIPPPVPPPPVIIVRPVIVTPLPVESESVPSVSQSESESISTASISGDIPPLAEPGGWALINLILMVAGVIAGIVLLVMLLIHNKRDEEEEQEYEYQETDDEYAPAYAKADEDEDEEARKYRNRSLVFRTLAIITGVVSLVVFFLTEDLSQPMIIFDRWTVLMVILALVETAFIVLMRYAQRKQNEDEDDEDEYGDEEAQQGDATGPEPMTPAETPI